MFVCEVCYTIYNDTIGVSLFSIETRKPKTQKKQNLKPKTENLKTEKEKKYDWKDETYHNHSRGK